MVFFQILDFLDPIRVEVGKVVVEVLIDTPQKGINLY